MSVMPAPFRDGARIEIGPVGEIPHCDVRKKNQRGILAQNGWKGKSGVGNHQELAKSGMSRTGAWRFLRETIKPDATILLQASAFSRYDRLKVHFDYCFRC
jgi:hypothetical protein